MHVAMAIGSRRGSREYRPMAYGYDRSDAEPGPTVQGLMLVGALALLGAGGFFLATAAMHPRETKIAALEASARNWTVYRDALAATNFSVRVKGRETLASMAPDRSPDPLAPDEQASAATSDLPRFATLKQVVPPPLPSKLFPRANWSRVNAESVTLVFTATYAPGARGGAGAPTTSTFETAPLALLRKEARHAMTPQPEAKCRSQQRGVFNYRTRLCDVYSRLSAVCVVAERGGEAGATWALSTAHGAPGCDHRTGWGVPTYAVAQVSARAASSSSSSGASASSSSSSGGAAATAAYRQALKFPSVAFTDVRITLREAHDPYLAAAKITHDSLDFGMSVHERLITAAVLLVMGLLFLVNPAISLYQACKAPDERDPFASSSPTRGGGARRGAGRGRAAYDDDGDSEKLIGAADADVNDVLVGGVDDDAARRRAPRSAACDPDEQGVEMT